MCSRCPQHLLFRCNQIARNDKLPTAITPVTYNRLIYRVTDPWSP